MVNLYGQQNTKVIDPALELKLSFVFISLETKCLFLRVFFEKYNGTIIFEL